MSLRRLRLPVFAAALSVTLPLAAALPLEAQITGVVTNKTTNKPAAGDEVILIQLRQGMQESTRTTTDSKGHYSLALPPGDEQAIHLVKVMHDKAAYFRPAPPGTESVNLDVFNAAAKVAGVVTEADVIRVQTDDSGQQLKVIESFFLKNDSTPPTTQFSDKPFEFTLPAGAVVEGSAALAPGGMPVQSPPVPLGNDHYTFAFPIRPGSQPGDDETRFQVSYHLPYSGSFTFKPGTISGADNIALVLPKSMEFKAANGAAYSAVTDQTAGQAYVLRNAAQAKEVSFTVSGHGELPRDQQQADPGAGAGPTGAPGAAAGAPATTDGISNSPLAGGRGLNEPGDPEGNRDPVNKYKWWIISGLALLMAAVAGIMLRRRPETVAAASQPATGLPPHSPTPRDHNAQLLTILKEELFTLETERLQGKVTEDAYTAAKNALELILRRALTRSDIRAKYIAPAEETKIREIE